MNTGCLFLQTFTFSSDCIRMSVLIETTEGTITIDLYTDKCPNTCLNFLKLCKIKYYNNCLFFNVQQNFIAQTGDPTGTFFFIVWYIGTGKGGTSIFGKMYNDKWNPGFIL